MICTEIGRSVQNIRLSGDAARFATIREETLKICGRSAVQVLNYLDGKSVMDNDSEISNSFELPSDLINEDPEALKQWLLTALVAGRPAVLSGKRVSRVGTAALQLLIAFRKECDVRAIPCELREPSRALLEALDCTGLAVHLGVSTPETR